MIRVFLYMLGVYSSTMVGVRCIFRPMKASSQLKVFRPLAAVCGLVMDEWNNQTLSNGPVDTRMVTLI